MNWQRIQTPLGPMRVIDAGDWPAEPCATPQDLDRTWADLFLSLAAAPSQRGPDPDTERILKTKYASRCGTQQAAKTEERERQPGEWPPINDNSVSGSGPGYCALAGLVSSL